MYVMTLCFVYKIERWYFIDKGVFVVSKKKKIVLDFIMLQVYE